MGASNAKLPANALILPGLSEKESVTQLRKLQFAQKVWLYATRPCKAKNSSNSVDTRPITDSTPCWLS
jgi:hypothetical protein